MANNSIYPASELFVFDGEGSVRVCLTGSYQILEGFVTSAQVESRSAWVIAISSNSYGSWGSHFLRDWQSRTVVIQNFNANASRAASYSQQLWVTGWGVTVETQGVVTRFTFLQADIESFSTAGRTGSWESGGRIFTQVNFFILVFINNFTGGLYNFTGEFNVAVCCHCVGSSCRQYQGSQRQ